MLPTLAAYKRAWEQSKHTITNWSRYKSAAWTDRKKRTLCQISPRESHHEVSRFLGDSATQLKWPLKTTLGAKIRRPRVQESCDVLPRPPARILSDCPPRPCVYVPPRAILAAQLGHTSPKRSIYLQYLTSMGCVQHRHMLAVLLLLS